MVWIQCNFLRLLLLVVAVLLGFDASQAYNKSAEYRPEIYYSIFKILKSTRAEVFAKHIDHYNQLLDGIIEHASLKHTTILQILQGEAEESICARLLSAEEFPHSPVGHVHQTHLLHNIEKRSVFKKIKRWNVGKSMENMKDKMDLLKGLIDSGKEVALAGTAAYKAIRKEIVHIHDDDDDAIVE